MAIAFPPTHGVYGRVLSSRPESPFGPTIEMPFQLRNAGTIARGLIGLGVIAAIFFFLVRGVVANWSELRSEETHIQPLLLLLSFLPAIAGMVVVSHAWARLVGHLADVNRPPMGLLARVFFYSWLGRYVPGKVAYVLGRFYLGRSIGLPAAPLAGSMAYEAVLQVVAASVFATLTLVPSLAVQSENVLPYLALPAVAGSGVIALHPRILGRALHVVSRLFGRSSTEVDRLLTVPQMAEVIGLYAVAFSLNGLGLFLITVSLTPYSVVHVPLVAGAYALAGVVGMLSLFAPAGLGVREGVLVAVLQLTMPVEVAILISLAARVWATAVDLLLLGGCFGYDHLSGERLLLNAIRGSPAAVARGEPSGVSDL